MRDAVADVLVQRRALSRGESSGILPSLLLHGALVALFVFAARPRPVELPPQVLTVRLAPAAAGAKSRNAAVAQPRVEPESKPESKPAEAEPRKAPPALKNQETLFGQAAKPKARDDKPAPASATLPAAKQPDTPGASFAEGGQGGVGIMPGVGAAGITGLEGGNFPYTFYLERMVTLIGDRWIRPQTGVDITTVVYFQIHKDGSIREAEIRKSSGSGVFDRAAIRAVIESSPLPRLPAGYGGSYLGVHLTFH